MSVVVKEKKTFIFNNIENEINKAYNIKLDCDKKITPRPLNKLIHRYSKVPLCLINGVRRSAISFVKHPRFLVVNIDTTDDYIRCMSDYVETQLQLIVVQYMEETNVEYIGHINVENTTENKITVTSADITFDKKLDWGKKVKLCELLPGCYLKVDIKVEWGTARQHSTFCNFGPLYFKPYKYDLDSNKITPSYSVVPENYDFGLLACFDFIDPLKAIILAWTSLLDILTYGMSLLQDVKSIPYNSNELNIINMKKETVYKFKNQDDTLGGILPWYVYNKYKCFIHGGKKAPYDKTLVINIIADDPTKKMVESLQTAIKDVKSIISQLNK